MSDGHWRQLSSLPQTPTFPAFQLAPASQLSSLSLSSFSASDAADAHCSSTSFAFRDGVAVCMLSPTLQLRINLIIDMHRSDLPSYCNSVVPLLSGKSCGEEGGGDSGAKGLRLCMNGRMGSCHSRLLPARKGALTLPCVGVFPHPAFYQACFRLPSPIAWTFMVNNDGSIEQALGSKPLLGIYI